LGGGVALGSQLKDWGILEFCEGLTVSALSEEVAIVAATGSFTEGFPLSRSRLLLALASPTDDRKSERVGRRFDSLLLSAELVLQCIILDGINASDVNRLADKTTPTSIRGITITLCGK
jgi:hypothetical protein